MKRKTLDEIREEVEKAIAKCRHERVRLMQENETMTQRAINVGRWDAYEKVRKLLNGWRDKL